MFVGLFLAAGCQHNPLAPPGAVAPGTAATAAQQQQEALLAQQRQLQEARAALDRDNIATKQLLAQSQQTLAQREQELAALRDQLRDAANQLAAMQQQKREAEQQAEALLASSRRGGGAIIKPNSSLQANLPKFNLPDVAVRQEGDVIRVTIPSDRLFTPTTAQLAPQGAALLDQIAAELAQRYLDQTIGIEGHCDGDPATGAAGTLGVNPHQLTTAQASAVLERLASSGRLRANQLFVVGHGANFPIYSNATPEGRAQNRRIELVIYPDRTAGRG